ncbi:hypothetical protein LC609_37610 [Nostoc sp. XA013]|nr:hypothetical protein [Nostoc sp. XA013]
MVAIAAIEQCQRQRTNMTYAVKGYQEIATVMRVDFGVIALMQCLMRSL